MSHTEKLSRTQIKMHYQAWGVYLNLTKPLIFVMVVQSQPETLLDTACK